MKTIIDAIFKNFWLIFLTMITIAVIDLISLTVGSKEFGAGFVIAFIYFVGWFFYNWFKK